MLASTSISRRIFEAVGHKLAKLNDQDLVQTKPQLISTLTPYNNNYLITKTPFMSIFQNYQKNY